MTTAMIQARTPSLMDTLFSIFLLSISALLAGCQEDSRATKTSTVRSAELTEARLNQTTGHLFKTFGQNLAAENERSTPTLSWSAPLTRADGTALPLSEIAGYRIYYRKRHEKESKVIEVMEPAVQQYPLAFMSAGVYELSVSAVDNHGLESEPSEPVTVEII